MSTWEGETNRADKESSGRKKGGERKGGNEKTQRAGKISGKIYLKPKKKGGFELLSTWKKRSGAKGIKESQTH